MQLLFTFYRITVILMGVLIISNVHNYGFMVIKKSQQ